MISNNPGNVATVTTVPSGTQTVAIDQTGPNNDVDANITNASLAITAASLPLPNGASTEAKQDTGNTNLASIDSKLTSPLNVTGTVTANLGTIDGASTAANQATANASLSSIDSKLTSPIIVAGTVSVNEPVSVDDNGGSLTVDGTVAVSNFPAVQPVNDNGGSLTVDGSVSVSNFPAVQPVSDNGGSLTVDGPLTNTELRASAVPVSGTVSVNQPIAVTDNSGSLTVDGTVSISGSVAVTGPLTDAQLRASTVPISGTVTANAGTGTFLVDNAVGQSVAIDDNGGSLTVDGTVAVSNFPATQPVLGTVTTNQGTSPWVVGIDQTGDNNDVDVINGAGADAVNIQDGGNSITVDGSVTANSPVSSSSSVTSVASSATNVTLLASNANRKMATFFNHGSKLLHIKLGTTASLTSFTVRLDANSYYELPLPIFTGQIDGIWDAANGSARITELT